MPATEETFTIAPPPASSILGTVYLQVRNTPLTFTASAASHPARSSSRMPPVRATPTLLCSTLGAPKASAALASEP